MRRPIPWLIAAALAIVAMPAATFGQPTLQADAITVAIVPSTDMTPFYYAQSQGMFLKARLDITVQAAPTGAVSMTAVVGNASQIGFSNMLALSVAHQRGIPIEVLAPGAQYDTNAPNVGLLVWNNSPLKSARDLEDHVVGVTGLHDLLAVATFSWIQKNGGDPQKVKFVELRPPIMAEALQTKRVDAVAIFEPFMGSIVAAGGRVIGKPYDEIASRFVNTGWFALAPWVEQHRDTALRFARVLSQAATFTNAHYDELIPMIASETKLSPETLQRMAHVHVPSSLTPDLVQPIVDLAARYHEIPEVFRARDMMLAGIP